MNESELTGGSSKRSKSVLLIFIVLIVVILPAVFLYLFKDSVAKLFGKHNQSTEITLSSNVENTDSIFSSMLNNNDGENNPSPDSFISMDTAQSFYKKLRVLGENNWEPILSEGQTLVEVIDAGDSVKSFKLIYSKNPSLNYQVGDIIDFKPKVLKSDSLVVRQGSSISFALEEGVVNNFSEKVLDVGDRFVFTCQEVDCNDGILSWGFVLKKD